MKRFLDWAVFGAVMFVVAFNVPWDTTGAIVALVAAFLTAPRTA